MMTTTTKKKKIQQEEEEEKPNPEGEEGGGGEGGGSTSISPTSPGPPPDRISELPVEILHRILGFLEMDELLIGGTSLVSTKWRYLWKSVSTLNFPACTPSSRRTRKRRTDDDDDDSVVVDNGGGDGLKNNVEKFQNFVDNVLRLRDSQASKIQIFRYYYCDYYSNSRGGWKYEYLERLHNFIVSAVVNQGAEEIEIIFSYLDNESSDNNRIIHFNPSIFTSGLLGKFTFVIFNSHVQIQFPRSMCCSTQLTHLSLSRIRLPEGDAAAAQLHLVCPLLETLFIHNCYSEHLKVLDISAPRLSYLSIHNRRFGGSADFLGGCRLEIRTPNLITLDYAGCVYVDCFTENLPHVFFASLDFTKQRDMVEQTNSFAIKLLKGLTSAESLTLGGFEVFSLDTLKVLLKPFTSLRTLKLVSSCKISSIHVMVHILHICNSVEKFGWDVDLFVKVGGDEHLMLPQCRLSHLKHVHIKRLGGHENEIEFVKFLLKSSVVLEEIIIHTTSDSSKQSIEEKMKQFIEEEPLFRSIKLCVLQPFRRNSS